MSRLVKLLLIVILSVGVANASEVVKVFGLKDKFYAEVTNKKINRYKINDNLILSIKALKVDRYDGYDGGKSGDGCFVEGRFKKPNLKNWVYETKLYVSSVSSFKIIFTDEMGLTLEINRKGKQVSVENKKRGSREGHGLINIKAIYTNGTLSVYVDGVKFYSSKKRFGLLKSFYQPIHYYDTTLIDINLSGIK